MAKYKYVFEEDEKEFMNQLLVVREDFIKVGVFMLKLKVRYVFRRECLRRVSENHTRNNCGRVQKSGVTTSNCYHIFPTVLTLSRI